MFCKLEPYWWPARWRTAAGIAVLLAATGMKWLIDYVLGTQPPPAWIVRIWPPMAATGRADALLAVCLAAVVVAIVHRLATFGSQMPLTGVGGELVRQLRCGGYILDASPEIVDRRGATPPARIRGQVEFRDVSFEYSPEQPILRTVTFAVQPGEVVALVGSTGAGKSTLASLLLRFYDPRSGAVLLDGCDLRDLPLGWLRSQVSVVLQDSLLLSGTIRDNIAYGCPGASPADIRAAARKAHAHEFIDALPNGYDTSVAERGVNLSGEQKQRLAIARAFLKNAPILVLDEPTSALDAHTGGALLTVLKSLMQGRTTLIIAHRLSTVRLADRIVVLYQGRLLEQGSHDELIRVDSFYRRLYHAQWRWETPWLPYLAAAASGS